MKVKVIDTKGTKIEDLDLDKAVFGVKPNLDLVAQYVHVYKTNQRQGTSSTKTRGEVSGGGKKPWRQKGTGRARHGSIRSPIWVHGGITHGPKPKSHEKSMPKKMRKKAMAVVLSDKLKDKKLMIVDKIDIRKPSTKKMAKIIEKLKLDKSTLVILDKPNQNVIKSISNLPEVDVTTKDSVNVYELLDAEYVLAEKEAIKSLEERFK